MTKDRRAVLEKLDRVILFLTLERIDARTQKDWEEWNEATIIVRNARLEVKHAPDMARVA